MPFGNVVGADGKPVRDAKEQALVERIKELRPRRLTIKNIAATLTRDGAPARGGRWHATTVARLLRRAAWNARTPRRVTADLIVRADLRNSRISPRDLRSRMTKCSASGSIQHSLPNGVRLRDEEGEDHQRWGSRRTITRGTQQPPSRRARRRTCSPSRRWSLPAMAAWAARAPLLTV